MNDIHDALGGSLVSNFIYLTSASKFTTIPEHGRLPAQNHPQLPGTNIANRTCLHRPPNPGAGFSRQPRSQSPHLEGVITERDAIEPKVLR